jgi:DNA-binding HxlR family transcriptional regulator
MWYNSHFCPYFHRAVELIGQRWSGAILREMLAGATRFSEIKHAIPDISDRMLAERLKSLEAYELVERKVFAETPVRVEYHLTDRGRALGPVFAALGAWANKYGCTEVGKTDPNVA